MGLIKEKSKNYYRSKHSPKSHEKVEIKWLEDKTTNKFLWGTSRLLIEGHRWSIEFQQLADKE